MAYEIHTLNVDLIQDRATVAVRDKESGAQVHVTVKIETPGNQPENRLEAIAKDAAREALQGALDAL